MARLSEAILKGAYAGQSTSPMLDLTYGGQGGWAPNLKQLHSNQAYVSRPMVAMVLEFPRFFRAMPNTAKWQASLKALIEQHARSITGFNSGLTVDTDEHPVGGSNEMQQEFVNVTRARTQPNFTWQEKYGRPINHFLNTWIRYGMMDPDTKSSLLATLTSFGDDKGIPTDLLGDINSMTCIFFEPCPLFRTVTNATICTNMFPLGDGDVEMSRDLTQSQSLREISVEFAAVSQHGLGVLNLAQKILDSINVAGADPYRKAAMLDDISADVKAIKTSGYTTTVEKGTPLS